MLTGLANWYLCRRGDHIWGEIYNVTETKILHDKQIREIKLGKRRCLRPKCDIIEVVVCYVEYWPSGCSFNREWRRATDNEVFDFNHQAEKFTKLAMVRGAHTMNLYHMRERGIASVRGTYGVHSCLLEVSIEKSKEFEEFCKEKGLSFRYEPKVLQERLFIDDEGRISQEKFPLRQELLEVFSGS